MSGTYTVTAFRIDLKPGDQEFLTDLLKTSKTWVDDPDDPEIGFEVRLTDTELVITDEGGWAFLSNIATFLMIFLRDRRPGAVVAFAWACYSDRAWPDEFGGGACVIDSKENVEWMNTYQWVDDTMKKMGGPK